MMTCDTSLASDHLMQVIGTGDDRCYRIICPDGRCRGEED